MRTNPAGIPGLQAAEDVKDEDQGTRMALKWLARDGGVQDSATLANAHADMPRG